MRPSGAGLGVRFALIALLAACGEDEAGPTGETGSFQITVSPATLTLEQGGSGSVTASLTRVGFSGVVTVTASGLPAGVTATVTPPQLSGSAVGATVAVTVGASVTPGTYPVTLTATAAGLSPVTATYPLTVTPAPDYALTASPATLSIAAGSSGSTTVNIQRTNFPAGVALTLLDPPGGITGAFTPAVSTDNSAELAVAVAATVAPGSYALTIQGTAAGVGLKTTALNVTVTAALASYSIGVSPATLSLPAGGSGAVNVVLARTGFTGLITVAFENPPAGITGSLAPASTTGSSSVLTINVAATTPTGIHQLALRGAAAGLTDRVAFVQLTVTAPAPGTVVEYRFCDPAAPPLFFAYQDGTGAWRPVTGVIAGGTTRYAFNVTEGRGGVLAVHATNTSAPGAPSSTLMDLAVGRSRARSPGLRPGVRRSGAWASATAMAGVHWTEVRFGSTAELVQDGSESCDRSRATKTIHAQIRGISPGEFGILGMGGNSYYFVDGDEYSDPAVFTDVPDGVFDVVGARLRGLGETPDRTVVMRGVDVPDGGTLPQLIDFQGPASAPAASATATVTGLAGEHVEIYVDVITANSWSLVWYDGSPDGNDVRGWGGLATSSMASGDMHALYAWAGPPGGNLYDYRLTVNYVGPVSDQTVPLGAWVAAASATQISGGGYPRFRFQGALPSVYDKGVEIDVVASEEEGITYSLLATGAYLAASGSALTYDLAMPDVASLTGFPAAARLPVGDRLVFTTALGFTGTGAFEHRPTAGSQFRASLRASSIQVP